MRTAIDGRTEQRSPVGGCENRASEIAELVLCLGGCGTGEVQLGHAIPGVASLSQPAKCAGSVAVSSRLSRAALLRTSSSTFSAETSVPSPHPPSSASTSCASCRGDDQALSRSPHGSGKGSSLILASDHDPLRAAPERRPRARWGRRGGRPGRSRRIST